MKNKELKIREGKISKGDVVELAATLRYITTKFWELEKRVIEAKQRIELVNKHLLTEYRNDRVQKRLGGAVAEIRKRDGEIRTTIRHLKSLNPHNSKFSRGLYKVVSDVVREQVARTMETELRQAFLRDREAAIKSASQYLDSAEGLHSRIFALNNRLDDIQAKIDIHWERLNNPICKSA